MQDENKSHEQNPSIDGDLTNETKQEARKHPRSSRAIGESEEWLFTALKSIGDAVIATDAAGMIVFMNTVAVTLTGWSEEEAQGRDSNEVFRIVNESTRLPSESPVTKVIRDGVISGLANHTILIARDGVEHSIDDSGSPIRDKDGNMSGVVLIFRDVTEKRKSEQTHQQQQEILQTLFDHIPVIVAFLDEKHRFKWINKEWTSIVGWSLDEMQAPERIHTFHPSLLAPPMSSDFVAGYTAITDVEQQIFSGREPDHNGKPGTGPHLGDAILSGFPNTSANLLLQDNTPSNWRDLAITTKQGNLLYLSWATVMLSNGTSIGIGKDITERRRLEALTEEHLNLVEMRNARLEQAMRETDHRVKNNLQMVAALLDIQVTSHETTVPVEDLTQVRMHIVTLASIHDMLVQDVRDEANIGNEGKTKLISAREALIKLLPMLQRLVGEQRIRWTVDDIHLPVKQGMSLAVLINELVNNAVKHGGHQVDLRLTVAEREINLEVCDDGPGFSQSFSPATSANFGLELVESIGRLDLGGKTTYENRPEGGACVRITFPMPKIPTIAEAS